jgi:hypothetical protein
MNIHTEIFTPALPWRRHKVFLNFTTVHHTKDDLQESIAQGRFHGPVDFRQDQVDDVLGAADRGLDCYVTLFCLDGFVVLRGKVAHFEIDPGGKATVRLVEVRRA